MKLKSVVMPGRVRYEPDELGDRYGKFIAEPLERGFGTTLGNSLRRVLLSSIQGAAVKAVRINGVLQEVSYIPGVVEDVTDIILNLKGLRVKNHRNGPVTLYLQAKGEREVKASDIEVNPDVEIMNPELHIATLEKEGELEMELFVDVGRGYAPADRESSKQSDQYPLNTIVMDAIFTPIERVKYTVENARVGDITDYDRLILEITTDGSINPQDALAYAAKILKDHLFLFINFPDEDEVPAEKSEQAEESVNPYLSKGVEELELSVRAYNCLRAANIKSIGELVGKTESEMLKYRNFGKKSLNEIKDVLEKYGLGLGMDVTRASQQPGELSETQIPAMLEADLDEEEDIEEEEESVAASPEGEEE